MTEPLLLYFVQTGRRATIRGHTTVGVSEGNGLVLSHYVRGTLKGASRTHFSLFHTNAGYVITDLGSTNGTEVNGERLRPFTQRPLVDGDLIRLARNEALTIQVQLKKSAPNVRFDPEATDDLRGLLEWSGEGVSGLFYDTRQMCFIVNGQRLSHVGGVYLTQREFQLLHYLYSNANRVCSYDELSEQVWQGGITNNAIARTVSKLRDKLNALSPDSGTRHIRTVHGQGYLCQLHVVTGRNES